MTIEKFEDLEIWQEARSLSKTIFSLTKKDPFSSDYKFRDQIRTSSGSIMDNIAEGFERGGNKEFSQFLSISKGSCGECRSQCYRAFDYEYIKEDTLLDLVNQANLLSKRIGKMMSYLNQSDFKGPKFKK